MKETDSIPRLQDINYLFETLRSISENKNFEEIRQILLNLARTTAQSRSGVPRTGYSRARRFLGSDEYTYWTNVRDGVRELIKLGFVQPATLPSKKEYLERFRTAQFKLTTKGKNLMQLSIEDDSLFRDNVFEALYTSHLYLRSFLAKVEEQELIFPIFTLGKVTTELQDDSPSSLKPPIMEKYLKWFSRQKAGAIEMSLYMMPVKKKVEELVTGIKSINSKKLVSCLNEITQRQFLSAYGLEFDNVTFDQLTRLCCQFWVINYSYLVPSLNGFVVYSTAKIEKTEPLIKIKRHRLSDYLNDILREIPLQFNAIGKPFIPIYELRAAVCYKLKINDDLFDATITKIFQEKLQPNFNLTLLTDLMGTMPPSALPLKIGDKCFYSLSVMSKEGYQ